MPRSPFRFLLLQARNPGDIVRPEERAQFAARLGVDVEQVVTRDLLTEPLPMSVLEGFDVLLVGGSGEYSVKDSHPGIERAKDFLCEAAAASFPTFASCFGYQLLVEGMGGSVQKDEPRAEVGTFELELTTEGAADPLFSGLPERFNAQLGHKDRAVVLPEGVRNLARSARCPHQALRVGDKPVYAAQFHPELVWTDNRGRFERYMDDYGRVFGMPEAERMLREDFRPGPESAALLDRFVRLFLLGEEV